MTDSDHQSRDGDGDVEESSSPVTRRGFLLATGAASAGVATEFGRAGARTGSTRPGAVAVEGSRRHRPLSREVAATLRSEASDVEFAVRSSGTDAGFRRFAAGEVDAHLASRPMAPAERSRAADGGVEYERVELALDAVALVHPERTWYDCVTGSRLAEAWTGDADARTYAEVADGDEPAPGRERSATELRGVAPDADASVVVRGTREFQYERGFGGVGYYRPDPERVRPLAAVRREGIESYTPLVGLAFLYLNRDSLQRVDPARVARAYRDRVARRTGEVTYFAEPS